MKPHPALTSGLLFGLLTATAHAQPPAGRGILERWRERYQSGQMQQRPLLDRLRGRRSERIELAGRRCAIWRPAERPAPLVVFSHGFHGSATQSTFLTKALAGAGYLVVAPDHRDSLARASGTGRPEGPETAFGNPGNWTDTDYRDRALDVSEVLAALKGDRELSVRIDWSRVALAGHSLGGYTVLGLAGAWPGWKLPQVKAVLALSPHANPYLRAETLPGIDVPVMYQTGSLDKGVFPFVARPGGAFDQTPPPACLLALDGAGHFAWSDLNSRFHARIAAASIGFLDTYLGGRPPGRSEQPPELRCK